MSKFLLRGLNGLVSLAVGLCLAVCGAYAAYALWDNQQIYSAAEDVQAAMQELKPRVSEDDEEGVPSFAELLAVNPDVRAWITVDNTHIDYPVLQGTDNLTYVNTDVYGEFALAGSIFMDSRNDPGFADLYTLLYGHHMEGGRMFGDLDKFADQSFFDSHAYGSLYYGGRMHGLEIFAMAEADAYDFVLYNTHVGSAGQDRQAYLDYVSSLASRSRDIGTGADDRIVMLSTCADTTNGRYVVFARITDTVPADPFSQDEGPSVFRSVTESGTSAGTVLWIIVPAASAALALFFILRAKRRQEKRKNST